MCHRPGLRNDRRGGGGRRVIVGPLSPPGISATFVSEQSPGFGRLAQSRVPGAEVTPPHPVSCLCWLVLIWPLWLSSVLNVLSCPQSAKPCGRAVPDSCKFERPARQEQENGCKSTSAPAASLNIPDWHRRGGGRAGGSGRRGRLCGGCGDPGLLSFSVGKAIFTIRL